MNILEFTKKYHNEDRENHEDWSKDWKKLLKQAKKEGTLALCFHTLLEQYFSFGSLKEIIEYDEKGKEDILNDKNTFKWACAFGNRYLIIYLNDKVKEHNLPGAINATIMQYRVDNLQTLSLLGYDKEIYTEPNMCQAISRANQNGCSLNIVEYLFDHIEKFPKLSTYVDKELEKQDWIPKIIRGEYPNTFEILFNLNNDNINKKIVEYAGSFIAYALENGQTKLLDKIMQSHLKDDFIAQYNKNKMNILTNNLSIDKHEEKLNYLIDKFPQLVKLEDIQLSMMNSDSFKINEFITKHRVIKFAEIKKAFIHLSNDEELFSRLLSIYPNIDYKKFKIEDVVKMSNNIYNSKSYEDSAYNYDNDYMILNRKLLLEHKDFKMYQEQLRTVLQDKKMYNLLYKEQIKKNLEEKLPPKPIEKRMKI